LSQLDQHSVESVAVPIVTQLLITARAIFLLYQFGIAQTAYSIMPPRRVFGDAAENTSHVRMAGMPFGQMEGMLGFERISHVIALQLLFQVIKQYCCVSPACDIRQAQGCSPAHDAR